MRDSVVIDDEQFNRMAKIKEFRGKLKWTGDLEEMRDDNDKQIAWIRSRVFKKKTAAKPY